MSTGALIGLVRVLYVDLGQPTGGPLHLQLDDGNVDDEFLEPAVLDERYAYLRDGTYVGYAQAGDPVDAEFLTALEMTCRAIVALLRRMPVEERRRAVTVAWNVADLERRGGRWDG